MSKYEKKSRRPEKLGDLIDKTNSLPHDYSLPSEVAVFAYGSAVLDHRTIPIPRRKRMFAEILKALPETFIDFHSWINNVVSGRTVTLDKSFAKNKNGKYRDVYLFRKYFLDRNEWIEVDFTEPEEPISFSPAHQLGIDIGSVFELRKGFLEIIDWNSQSEEIKSFGFPPSNPNRVRLCIKDGVISLDRDPILNVLMEEALDSRRILECPICKKIVWKKQLTSETCGLKFCVDTLGNKKRLEEAKAQKAKLQNHFQSRVKN